MATETEVHQARLDAQHAILLAITQRASDVNYPDRIRAWAEACAWLEAPDQPHG